MKNLLLFYLITVSLPVFSQDYKVIKKISKRCSTIFDGEYFGLLYNNEIVQKMEYSEYDFNDGLIVFNKDQASVCWNDRGEEVLRLNDGNMMLTEDYNYLLANKRESQQALYNRSGKEIVPFGNYEFEFYEDGVLIKKIVPDFELNTNGEQIQNSGNQFAYFSKSGEEILPFDSKTITVVGEYEDMLTVTDNKVTRLYLSHNPPVLPYRFSQFSDYAFALDHEVTIEEYLYFLGNQQETGLLLNEDMTQIIPVSDLLPDTNKVEEKLRPLYRYVFPQLLNEDFESFKTEVNLTTRHTQTLYMSFQLNKDMKKLAQFPVTGITKAQAEKYCEWLSAMCSEYMDYDVDGAWFDFRLPTPGEWEKIASDGMNVDSRRYAVPDSVNNEGCMMFVYNSTAQCKNYSYYLKSSKGGGAVPSTSGPVDAEFRYHAFGNVAEMTSEDYIAKGGSYIHTAKTANLKNNISYSSPEPWLGFRIVGEYRY